MDEFDQLFGTQPDEFDQLFGTAPAQVPPPEGGLKASLMSTAGQYIKGAGQAAADFIPGVSQANPVSTYGQSVIDANPTAINKLSDVIDKPVTAVKEAVGNVAPSVAGALGIRALGQAVTSAAPYATAINPLLGGLTAVAGQAISWGGPIAMAALPSYGGIRGKQIEKDPDATSSGTDKAIAALGAATVGAIEQKFGPQDWATKLVTKEGRDQLAKMMASTTLKGAVVKGAGKGALVEGAEELVQNPVEQLAAYDNPLTKESLEETALGGVMGAIGGGVAGGAFGGGARRSPQAIDRIQEQTLNNLLKDTNVSVTDGKASFVVGDQEVSVDPIELGERLTAGETLATMPQDFLFGERGAFVKPDLTPQVVDRGEDPQGIIDQLNMENDVIAARKLGIRQDINAAENRARQLSGIPVVDDPVQQAELDWQAQYASALEANRQGIRQDPKAAKARFDALFPTTPGDKEAAAAKAKEYKEAVSSLRKKVAEPAPFAETPTVEQAAKSTAVEQPFGGALAPEPPSQEITYPSGRPFANERAMATYLKSKKEDPALFEAKVVEGGVVAVRKPDAPQASTVESSSGNGVAASSPRGATSLGETNENENTRTVQPRVSNKAAEDGGRESAPGADQEVSGGGFVTDAQLRGRGVEDGGVRSDSGRQSQLQLDGEQESQQREPQLPGELDRQTNLEVSTPGAGEATPPASTKVSFVNRQAYDNYLATNNLKPEGVSTSVSPEGVITVDPAAPVFTAATKGAALGYISRNKLQATHEVTPRPDGGADVVLKVPETYESLQAKNAQGEVQEITATQLFSSIAKAKNPVTRNLGKLLQQFTPQSKLATIKVVIDPNAKSASYRPSNRTVTVKDLNQFETSLHEIVHSVTVAELAATPGMQKRLKQVMLQARREAIKQGLISEKQMKEIEAAGGSKAFKNKFPAGTLSGVENIAYAFANEKEFLAQAFSSPQVQQFLESVQINNGGKLRSAWDALVEKVMQVLGIPAGQQTAFSETLKIAAQLAGQEMSIPQSGEVFESLDTALKAGHDRVMQAAQALANPKAKLHDFYLQHADKWLGVLPPSHIAQTFGKKISQLGDLDRHSNQLQSTRTKLSDDAFDVYGQAKKVAEKGAGVDAFNDALLKGTYFQMLPWADQYGQDWVSGKTKEEQIRNAQVAWEKAGMAKSTGKHYLQAWREANVSWKKLDKASQTQFMAVIGSLKDIRQRERDNLLAFIEVASKDDPDLRAKLMSRFDATFSNIKGIYAPLSRYGKFWLEYQDKDGIKHVEYFETTGDRDTGKLAAIAEGAKSETVSEGVKDESVRGETVIPNELINQVFARVRENYLADLDPDDTAAIADAESRAQDLVSDINQTFLRWLPDTAALKNSIHRKSTKGASTDMLRSYLDYMLRHSSSIAWMEVGRKIDADIQSFAKENQELKKKGGVDLTMRGHLLNNTRKWLQAIKQEKVNPIASFAGKWSTAYYMTSPSTFLVQLTQLPALTLPNLSSRFGWGKASSALGKGFQQAFSKDFSKDAMLADAKVNATYLALHRRVSEAERTDARPVGSEWHTPAEKAAMVNELNYKQKQLLMLREAVAMNLLDISAVHEAQAIAFGKEDTVAGRAMKWAMLPMQYGELGSRKAAALATFDLATKNGKDFFTAMQEIKKTVDETLYSYAKEDKGYLMQGSIPRVLLQFQTYRIKTALRLGILLRQSLNKSEDPKVRESAWKEFKGIAGMSALLGGANGLVFGSLLFGVANLFGGDDDEPWDAKLAMTNWLKETFGETVGDAAMFGLPSLLGVNVSERIGMSNIFGTQTSPPSGAHGAALAAWYAGNLLGPGYSVAQSWVKGYDQMMNKGNYMRGLEEATPKPIRDALKAYRVGTEGLKDGQGKRLLDDAAIGPDEILMVGLGFTPSEIAAAQTANFTLNQMKTEVSERRGRLIRDAANAIIEGGDTTEALESIRSYNARMPGRAISGRDLRPVVRRLVLGDLGETDRTDLMMADQFGIPTYTENR